MIKEYSDMPVFYCIYVYPWKEDPRIMNHLRYTEFGYISLSFFKSKEANDLLSITLKIRYSMGLFPYAKMIIKFYEAKDW